MSEFFGDEHEIIQQFLAEIKSLRFPWGYWWLIMMRKYAELYQALHGEWPKNLHLLWKEEDEMIESARAESDAHLNKVFRLDICDLCNDVVIGPAGMDCRCGKKIKFSL